MGFKKAKWLLIENLKKMNFYHYPDRNLIWLKNKLFTKEVSVDFVIEIIELCNGDDYREEPGPSDADDKKLHRFKKGGWYIKYCLRGGKIYIVSAHKDEYNA